ncbi:pyridoxal phosphate-dependent aminotransferase [Streptomyces xinghaiensis]|uniref:pyridoxal phosphate-dependent aminotransferase n=1 Tax=Streptomyces xinghaiensis TaxID=1038928 RepID=UPI0037894665
MEPMPPEPRGPALFGPPVEPSGLPVLPGLAERLAASAGRGAPEPVGGGPELLDAACGYWARRGLVTGPERLLAAAGPQPLLLALLAAVGGDVFTTRPCAPWHSAQPLVLGRPAYPVPVPAECGGVPDPFALLETVRRVRAEGGTPRVLVLSPADDPTGTTAPPELLHEVCEAAAGEGLLIISDETDRDALHPSPVPVPDTSDIPDTLGAPAAAAPPGDPAPAGRGRPVFVSPAEMLPGHVVVLAGLGTTLLPPGWPAAIARFPAGREGAGLRAAALGVLAGTRTGPGAPLAAAVAHALTEPPDVTERLRAAARLHGILAAALYRTVVRHGALCRPPRAGDRVYADLGPFGDALAARGIGDSVELEVHLTRRLGFPVAGGHRFGDPPDALRVRFTTEPLLAPDGPGRLRALTAADPLDSPHAARSLTLVTRALDEWSGG